MKSPENIVPPEDGPKLFELMRKVVDGEVEVGEIVDEDSSARAKIVQGPKSNKPKSRNFQTGASAMDEWQRKQEKRQDEKREAA